MNDDSAENVVRFFDNVCKGMEGLKDKHAQIILEVESKNDKIDNALKAWVNSTKQLIEEKYEQIFGEKYDEENFQTQINSWLIKFKDNQDLLLNIKLLHKSLVNMKSMIKSKIISSDPLCYTNLTDSLINKNKANKLGKY